MITTCSDPEGWWYEYPAGTWNGPFDEAADAVGHFKQRDVDRHRKLLNVKKFAPWETRVLMLDEHYKPCPSCVDGFINGHCCKTCEGSARVPR